MQQLSPAKKNPGMARAYFTFGEPSETPLRNQRFPLAGNLN